MKIVLTVIAILTIATSTAWADISIEVIDLQKKVMRVTYSTTYAKEGVRSYIQSFGTLLNKEFSVIEVIEKNTEQELEYEVSVNPKDNSERGLKIVFPNPVPKGGSYKVMATVDGQADSYISTDSKGRYVFKYITSHSAFFILPEGHAIVYSNYPVIVYEKKNKTVVQVKESGEKELIFKTRAFSTAK